MTRPEPVQISEAQLRSMTRDLDEPHASTFPEFRRHIADITSSRWAVLFGFGGVAALRVMAACGDSSDKDTAAVPSAGMSSTAGAARRGCRSAIGTASPSRAADAAAFVGQ
nr:hypothetical protein GCM10020063_042320 [Dactylosporangium thailandense]